jgi:hypothetical protein
MSEVTLWRAYIDYKDLKLESFQVEEKPQTYRVVGGHGISATGWSQVLRKNEVGKKYFLTAETALQGFIAACQRTIEGCVVTIEREQMRQAMAMGKLEELKREPAQ